MVAIRNGPMSAESFQTFVFTGLVLQVGRLKAGSLRDPLEHYGPDFFVIVEREDEVRPSLAGECSMRT